MRILSRFKGERLQCGLASKFDYSLLALLVELKGWKDENFVVFRDRKPAAVHHMQVIPRKHISALRILILIIRCTERSLCMSESVKELGKADIDLGTPGLHN